MRSERADLCQGLTTVNQVRAADGNLDWSQRVSPVARRHDFTGVRSPRFVGLSPRGIKNDHFRLAKTGGQRELLVTDADLVRFQERAFAKNVHAKSRYVYY